MYVYNLSGFIVLPVEVRKQMKNQVALIIFCTFSPLNDCDGVNNSKESIK
jgi:hypothetical protein